MVGEKAASFFRKVRQVLTLVVFVFVVLVAYLHFYGFPSFCKDAILRGLVCHGILLRIESLKLDSLCGVVARGVQYKSKPESKEDIWIGEIALRINFVDLLWNHFEFKTVDVDGSDIQIHFTDGELPIVISHVGGSIQFMKEGRIQLQSVMGDLFGLRWEINGRLDVRKTEKSSPPRRLPIDVKTIQSAIARIGIVKKGEPVKIELHVDGKLADLASLRVRAEIRGKSVVYSGWKADRILGRLSYSEGVLSLPFLYVEAGGGKIAFYGSWDVLKGPAQFELFSSLDPNTLFEGVAPRQKPRVLKELSFGVRPQLWIKGQADFSTPSAWRELKADASLWIREANWRGHFIQEIRGNGRVSGGRIEMSHLTIAQDFGRLTGNFGYEIETSAVTFDFVSTLDVAAVMKVFYPSDKNWFNTVRYTKPPWLRLEGRWLIHDPNGLQAKGGLNWQDWFSNDVFIRSVQAKVNILGRKFQFSDLELVRDEGKVTGSFSMDFASNSAFLDTNTSISFTELTRLIGPKTEEVFRPYHFLTPPRIKLQGIVSFGKNALNDLLAHVECARFKVWKLSTSNVVADVRSYRESLEISRYSSDFYGGRLEGDAMFDFTTPVQDWAFHCRIQKADFDRFTHDLWGYNKVEGNLTGWAEINGTMKSSHELKGRGGVKISDGILWRIPLFGELSNFIPILGVQKATKGYATFTIAQEKVNVDDMKISAGIMSLTAKGAYHFDQSLDFIVQGHFLRAFFGLGYLLDPFTKAFEYHLGGKLQARKWEPRFLPEELLLHFENNEPVPTGTESPDENSSKP